MKKYNTFEEFLDTSGIKETVTYETFIDGTNEYEVHNLLYYAYNELTENNNQKHSLKQFLINFLTKINYETQLHRKRTQNNCKCSQEES